MSDPKPTWPQACRAEGALTAYLSALDWLTRLPSDQMRERLEQKIEQKRKLIAEYRASRGN